MTRDILRNSAQHDEWIIDESVTETFPASDATSPSRPGSLVGSRYPAAAGGRRVAQSASAGVPAPGSMLTWTLILCSIAAVAFLWRRAR